jgi:hypothetical protein
MTEQRFTVTEQHIKLLRAANVSWGDDEFGAPCVDPERPYGNSAVYADIAHLIWEIETSDSDIFSDSMVEAMDRLHGETKTALQIFLATGVMEPGDYVAPQYTRNWRKVDPAPAKSE